MKNGPGFLLAIMAGTMAAFGSVSAKLAFSADILLKLCEQLVKVNALCTQVTVYLQGLMFIMIFVCNAVMWTLFTKSLQFCSSSVEATVSNTAANFLVTAVVGWILFEEELSLQWFGGSFLILCGLLFIHRGNAQQKNKTS